MMKKCLVLGGDGFIGSYLTESLLNKGYSVIVFGRFKNSKVKNLNHVRNRIELFSGDFLNTSELMRAVKGIDYVFHFISSSNPATSVDKLREEILSNVIPTAELLKICVKRGVKKVIFPSSGGSIYGDYPKGHASEDSSLNPISPHALGKLYVEKLLYYYFVQFKLNYVIYRISNAYGPRQSIDKAQGIIPTIIKKTLAGEQIKIYGNTIRDYIYVNDVSEFIAKNFSKKHNYMIYNLGSGTGTTLYELIDIISRQVKLPIRIKKLKKRSFDVERIVLNTDRIHWEFGFKTKVNLQRGIRRTFNELIKIE